MQNIDRFLINWFEISAADPLLQLGHIRHCIVTHFLTTEEIQIQNCPINDINDTIQTEKYLIFP